MKAYKICATLVLAVLVVSAMAVPILAKNGGSSGSKPSAQLLYLSGTPREMGMQYGAAAKDAISQNVADFWSWVDVQGLSKDEMVAAALAGARDLPDAVVEELKGMSKTCGVPYEDLLAFNKYGDDDMAQHACTCFAAAGDATENGRAISSKNRDLNNRQVMFLVVPENGYSFIGMMSAGALGVSQGINEKGVGIGHTWMPVPEYYEPGYSPFLVNQLVLEQAADAYEAISVIESTPKSEGATFILSDPYVAAFVETVPSVINTPDSAVQIITEGVHVHTNHYVMEPFYSWVIEDGFGYMWSVSYARYDRGLELIAENPVVDAPKVMEFTRDLENWGCGSPTEVIEAHPEVPDECWSNGWPGFSICNARTVSASVFECDDEYPEQLSTMWMAINNPAYSPYVPVHNGLLAEPALAGELFSDYVDGDAWSASSQLKGTADWGELIPVFEAWEAEKAVENAAAEASARAMLELGDAAGACLLVTESDGAIAIEGMELMLSLQDSGMNMELIAVPKVF